MLAMSARDRTTHEHTNQSTMLALLGAGLLVTSTALLSGARRGLPLTFAPKYGESIQVRVWAYMVQCLGCG